jgi:hypothetical protein
MPRSGGTLKAEMISSDQDFDESVASAWAEEAARRDEEMSRTGDPGIPAGEVFARIESLFL